MQRPNRGLLAPESEQKQYALERRVQRAGPFVLLICMLCACVAIAVAVGLCSDGRCTSGGPSRFLVRGACCVTRSLCREVTPLNCAGDLDGAYLGDNSVCAPDVCARVDSANCPVTSACNAQPALGVCQEPHSTCRGINETAFASLCGRVDADYYNDNDDTDESSSDAATSRSADIVRRSLSKQEQNALSVAESLLRNAPAKDVRSTAVPTTGRTIQNPVTSLYGRLLFPRSALSAEDS